MSFSISQAVAALISAFSERVTEQIKLLLETRHLYQNVSLEYQDIYDAFVATQEVRSDLPGDPKSYFYKQINGRWFTREATEEDTALLTSSVFVFSTPDVKLFCTQCGRIEAFNSISTEDFTARQIHRNDTYRSNRGIVQIFAFSFLCQACKQVPEAFLIRREALRLTLCGRAPIEHVDVPSFVPKQVQKYYSGAIVAYQSGQTLAANFLLRTLIEQWAQSNSENKYLQADEVLEEYMLKLPENFKSTFPSMRVLYGELSSDIHKATGSQELFEKARTQVTDHFDARRLFKI